MLSYGDVAKALGPSRLGTAAFPSAGLRATASRATPCGIRNLARSRPVSLGTIRVKLGSTAQRGLPPPVISGIDGARTADKPKELPNSMSGMLTHPE